MNTMQQLQILTSNQKTSRTNKVSFYNHLLDQTNQNKAYFLSAPIINDVMMGNFTIETYISFLNQAFHHVRYTASLLDAAAKKLTQDQLWINPVIGKYIAEEQGHEEWILNDIEACGFDRAQYAEGDAPYHSEILISYLFDYINRKNSIGVFGMVLVFEGTSSSLAPAVAKIVQEKLDLPDTAMTYLTTHGELDQEHIKFYEAIMNKITNEADQQAIIDVANNVYRLYFDIYRAIDDEAKSLAKARAA
jgi:pyrroloquinoline quinone (PQQ) biosynthesis protein C